MAVNLAGEEVVYWTPDGEGLSLRDIFWDMKPPPKRKSARYDPNKIRKKSRQFDPPADLVW